MSHVSPSGNLYSTTQLLGHLWFSLLTRRQLSFRTVEELLEKRIVGIASSTVRECSVLKKTFFTSREGICLSGPQKHLAWKLGHGFWRTWRLGHWLLIDHGTVATQLEKISYTLAEVEHRSVRKLKEWRIGSHFIRCDMSISILTECWVHPSNVSSYQWHHPVCRLLRRRFIDSRVPHVVVTFAQDLSDQTCTNASTQNICCHPLSWRTTSMASVSDEKSLLWRFGCSAERHRTTVVFQLELIRSTL